MEHKKELEKLYRQKKEKIDAYLKTKKNIKPEDKKKHDEALSEWEKAWAKYNGCGNVFGDAGDIAVSL